MKDISIDQLLNCKGRRFRAKIQGTPVEGEIQVEDNEVFLCQNVWPGSAPSDLLGYKYGWRYWGGEKYSPHVTDFQLIGFTPEEIENYKDWQVGDKIANNKGQIQQWEVIFRSGELVVCKNNMDVATHNYTCQDLWNMGFRLVAEPIIPESSEVIELTITQIAEKFGVSVDQLRIKDKPI